MTGIMRTLGAVGYSGGVGMLTRLGLAEPARRLLRGQPGNRRAMPVAVAKPEMPRPISVGPHNTQLYRYLLNRLLFHGARFVTSAKLYDGLAEREKTPYVLVRHDIDYTPENLATIVDVDRDCGIRSDIHVIVDGSAYDPAKHADEWKRLAEEGFLIGLHTLAPGTDDSLAYLREEIDRFADLLGFAPITFSIHGVSPSPADWAARKQRFLELVGPKLASLGFVGTHNISGPGPWIEDSRMGGEFAYLHEDWIDTLPVPGAVLGVLVHPDHWVSWPVRWSWEQTRVAESPRLERFIREARQHSARSAKPNSA